jgi:AcrR family transcriptional regulator
MAKKDPHDTRQHILEAALAVFAEKGYTGATTKAIACKAGINEVTLFRHFGNKKTLLKSVITKFSLMQNIENLFQKELTGVLKKDLFFIGKVFIDMMNNHAKSILMTIWEALNHPVLKKIVVQAPLKQNIFLANYLKKQIKNKSVRPSINPQRAAQTFFGMLFEYGISKLLAENPALQVEHDEKVLREMLDIFIKGIQVPAS